MARYSDDENRGSNRGYSDSGSNNRRTPDNGNTRRNSGSPDRGYYDDRRNYSGSSYRTSGSTSSRRTSDRDRRDDRYYSSDRGYDDGYYDDKDGRNRSSYDDYDPVRPNNRRSGSSKKAKAKKKRKHIIMFTIEILVLIVMVIVLYGVLKVTKSGKVNIDDADIVINSQVEAEEKTGAMKGYRNIALFGVDSRDKELSKSTRSDCIMIASINQDTGDVKLVSVYRDTYMNLSNDQYNKCNAAYAKGGPEQAINMLNMNLDMNITDFVTVGFNGLIDTIDALGGVEIDVQDNEISYLNDYQRSMFMESADDTKHLNNDIVAVTKSGPQTLSGLQATAYCRIRYVGNDFGRAERQRKVLMAVMEKAKKADPTKLDKIANSVFDEMYTSMDLTEIAGMLGGVSKYNIQGTDGFPQEDLRATGSIGGKGDCVVPEDLTANVVWLHHFLFDDSSYAPSDTVNTCSEKIKADTSKYVGSK